MLDLGTPIIFCNKHKLWSPSLCHFLQSHSLPPTWVQISCWADVHAINYTVFTAIRELVFLYARQAHYMHQFKGTKTKYLTIWCLMATIWVVLHSQPPDAKFYIFIQQIHILNILNMLHNLRFFLFKMPFIS